MFRNHRYDYPPERLVSFQIYYAVDKRIGEHQQHRKSGEPVRNITATTEGPDLTNAA